MMMNEAEEQEIEGLYISMYRKMCAYARSSLGNDALAEEAVQEAFQIALEKKDDFLNSPNPSGWLINTLRNVISNTERSHATAERILRNYLSTHAGTLAISEDRVSVNVLYENVADREEFKLLSEMAIEGKSILEMADERGISVNACKKRVERAKKKLQKFLKKDVTG